MGFNYSIIQHHEDPVMGGIDYSHVTLMMSSDGQYHILLTDTSKVKIRQNV